MAKVIKGNAYIENLSLFELPDFLKDVVVEGDFYCSYNSLTSLEGAPEKVEGDFFCSYNSLTSLEGAPEKVEGDFYCNCNSLTSLKGAPKVVEGYFDCVNNPLTSIEGLPKEIGASLYISFAPGISITEEEIRKISNIKGRVCFE
jgi:hypothetical protein